MKRLKIVAAEVGFVREPLVRKFGFKGGYLTELWQTRVTLRCEDGTLGEGLGTQSVLWSDSGVFSSMSEEDGNRLMFSLTEFAARRIVGASFETPLDLIDGLFSSALEEGRRLSGRRDLRPTFALNALVAVDNAVWSLYGRANRFATLGEAVPGPLRAGVPASHARCALIPLVSYATPIEEVRALADEGHFFFKIKIGHPGSQEEMLRKDCDRALEMHEALKGLRTDCSATGRACYYFDANGRYGDKKTFMRFVDHLERIGALEQTAIVEEPFDEADLSRVDDIPLRIAADESAHTVEDAICRMELGYGAMALKPIAKTMSMSLRVAAAAAERGVPCFCADLTVNPTLVEWNRAVARRLPQFPGIGDLGLLETNGAQNYSNWDRMSGSAPKEDVLW